MKKNQKTKIAMMMMTKTIFSAKSFKVFFILGFYFLSRFGYSIAAVGSLGAAAADEASEPPHPNQEAVTDKNIQVQTGIRLPPVGLPLKVGVQYVIMGIDNINDAKGTFDTTVYLQLHWNDPTLTFDPVVQGSVLQEYDFEDAVEKLTQIWNPQIQIANMKGKPAYEEEILLISYDGNVSYIQKITATFESAFNLSAFPFDKQRLEIELLSNRYDDTQIAFSQNQDEINLSGFNEGLQIAGWHIEGASLSQTDERGISGRFYPGFTLTLALQREAIGHFFSLVPLLLILFIPTLMTLFTDNEETVSVWGESILALIALSFTLNIRYPALRLSGGILSSLIGIIFTYQFVMICLTISIFNKEFVEKIKNKFLTDEIANFLRWAILIIFADLVFADVMLTKY